MGKLSKTLVMGSMLLCAATAAQAGTLEKITMGYNGVSEADGRSRQTGFSQDGRWVHLSSAASNLVPNDINGVDDVFVYDRSMGWFTRVSVADDGVEGNSRSHFPKMSASGRFVVFASEATNLTSDIYPYGGKNIFLHDRDANENGIYDEVGAISTLLLSKTVDGEEASGSYGAAYGEVVGISEDGSHVLFESDAIDLVPNSPAQQQIIYTYDRITGDLKALVLPLRGDTVMSATGQFVVYEIKDEFGAVLGINLYDRDADGNGIFDEAAGVSTEVVVEGLSDLSLRFRRTLISADGRYVMFASSDAGIVVDDTNGVQDLFVLDRQTGITTRVSIATDGAEGDAQSYFGGMTNNGRFIIMTSESTTFASEVVAPNLDADGFAIEHAYLHDRDSDGNGIFDESGGISTELLDVNEMGEPGDWGAGNSRVSEDGRLVLLKSMAQNVDPAYPPSIANGEEHLYILDRGVPAGDNDGDGFSAPEDCNDDNTLIFPGAPEIKFDDIDQDCNGYDMTLDVTKAKYFEDDSRLRIIVLSSLGAAADLQVEGVGPMKWKEAKQKWVLTAYPSTVPSVVTITGVEGSETVQVKFVEHEEE